MRVGKTGKSVKGGDSETDCLIEQHEQEYLVVHGKALCDANLTVKCKGTRHFSGLTFW